MIMKRNRLFAAAKSIFAVFATTLLFAGCEGLFPETPDVPPGTDITITATTENTVSRTALGYVGDVVWEQGDYIYVYDCSGSALNEIFTLVDGVNSTSGIFSGKQPDFAGPYQLYYGEADNQYAKVSATQKYDQNGGFSQFVNPMVCVCEKLGGDVAFKNVAGIIELQITGTQALSSIEISAKEPLSGKFNMYSADYENGRYSVEDGAGVTLTEMGSVQLDKNVARIFKFVVFPGTYTEFTVKMTNEDGSVVTKTAEGEIVVERSKITPIAGLVDDAAAAEKPRYATLSFVEEETNWHQAKVRGTFSSEVHGLLYLWGTDEYVNSWLSANPDKTIVDLMAAEGGVYKEAIEFTYDTVVGTNYNFYAVGLYETDGTHMAVVGEVHHLVHSPAVPYAENATVSIAVPVETITENSAVAKITPSTTFARVYVAFYSATVDANNPMELIYYNVFKYGSVYENVTSIIDAPVVDLAPEKEYVVYAIGETPEGKFTRLAKEFFTTTKHTEAAVTATATIAEVKDWSATFNVTMSQGAVGYKVGCWTSDVVNSPNNAEVDWAYQVSGLEGIATGSTFTLANLNEDTAYTAFFIAYDANDHYGPVSRVDFTTKAITPVQGVAGYEAMLGSWTLSYTDAQNTRHQDDVTITITENVAGKTFNIKGMMGAGGSVYGGSGDDTVIARYNEDGSIQIDWEKGIADASNYGQSYEIYCSLLVGTSIYYQGPMIWANEQGTYKIGHPSAPADSGYAFGAWQKSDGEFAGVVGGAHYDVVMKKVSQSTSSASTEVFGRKDTISPTWKSVGQLRLDKCDLTPVDQKGFGGLRIK